MNGWHVCIVSLEKVLKQCGVNAEAIQAAMRIGAR
jgi:hypothetical protein